ncbi:MAG: hypothetical protein RLZZ337_1343 [Bacteroidota bacterium]|jgi:hypothetical protein
MGTQTQANDGQITHRERMKLRIKDNSIRFRLAQNEVTELVHKGSIKSQSNISGQSLIYGIETTENNAITCRFVANAIVASIPMALITDWDTDERVGFENTTEGLYILIEKDWQCMKPRENEDESDLYANPQAQNS